MKTIAKSILALCVLLLFCVPVKAAEPFSCWFDSYFTGELESAEKMSEGYLIEHLASGGIMEYLIPKNAPEYNATLLFIQKT